MSKAEAPGRRRDLDRLRIAACLSTFCYHALQVFDLNPYYHLKSATPSPALDVAARLLHAVRMPLFFLIAGMALALALLRHPDRPVMRERVIRLLPPFLIGIVLLTPVIKYFEICDGRSISWSGIAVLSGPAPDLLTVLRRYFTQLRWFSWSHMWFPLYLLIATGLLLGVVTRLARSDGEVAPAGLAGGLAAFLALLLGVEIVLRPWFPWHIPNLFWDWASVAVYVVAMLAGAALVSRPAAEAKLRRYYWLFLLPAAAGAALYLAAPDWPLRHAGRGLWLWGFLCLAVGLGPLIARGRLPGEAYLAEAALPIYVLHHVPLIVVAFLVKDQNWPVAVRYSTIVLGALVATLTIYHVAVRPYAPVRLAFGMPRRTG